ncbi:MAG TPA: PQQ-binding-like beta-propeller repeat protein [Steroidobacteraceae bacterium]|nr:PQQ-binding-like beta-propeller repeat protein [Steroidobacteraceae bacterium]
MHRRVGTARRATYACVLLLGGLTGASGMARGAVAEASPASPGTAQAPERRGTEFGFAVFQQRCVSCHGNPAVATAPAPAALRMMSPERIYAALTGGVMKAIGDTLSEEDRRRVAESLSGQLLGSAQMGDAVKMQNHCSSNAPLQAIGRADWNGWGNGAANHRFQAASAAGLSAASVARLKLKWAFGYPGGTSAYGQPGVIGGRVFVGTDIGYVYSLDARTGCVYWSYRAGAGVRNAMTVGTVHSAGGARNALFFGDLKANLYALDARDGHELWKTRIDEHYAARVTAAPALYQGHLYVPISAWEGFQARVLDYPCCTAVGSVSALSAESGHVLWKTYTIAQRPQPVGANSHGVQRWAPAGVPIWNTPTVDAQRHVLYVGTGDASTYPAPSTSDAILALDLATGELRWHKQIYPHDAFIVGCEGSGYTENCPKVVGPDWDIPMSAMLTSASAGAKSLIVVGTKPGDVFALDANRNGDIVWHTAAAGHISMSDALGANGGASFGPVWGGAMDGLYAYFGSSTGGVSAVRLTDGARVWSTPLNATAENKVTHSAALSVIPGVVLVAGSDGRLWALDRTDGRALWSFETARVFETVNGVAARGGSIVSAGPVVAGGMLFAGSGYGVVNDTPGNVLLAFGLE